MSSQEVVDFIQSKITQKDENGVLRPLSSIVEEVRSITPLQMLHHPFQHAVFLHPSLVPDFIPAPSDWFVQCLGYLAALGPQYWQVQDQRTTSELEFGSFVTLASVSDLWVIVKLKEFVCFEKTELLRLLLWKRCKHRLSPALAILAWQPLTKLLSVDRMDPMA